MDVNDKCNPCVQRKPELNNKKVSEEMNERKITSQSEKIKNLIRFNGYNTNIHLNLAFFPSSFRNLSVTTHIR